MGLDAEDLASQVQRAIEPPAPQPRNRNGCPWFAAHGNAESRGWKAVGDGNFRFSGSFPRLPGGRVVLICSASMRGSSGGPAHHRSGVAPP
jgi:hypothetical protein